MQICICTRLSHNKCTVPQFSHPLFREGLAWKSRKHRPSSMDPKGQHTRSSSIQLAAVPRKPRPRMWPVPNGKRCDRNAKQRRGQFDRDCRPNAGPEPELAIPTLLCGSFANHIVGRLDWSLSGHGIIRIDCNAYSRIILQVSPFLGANWNRSFLKDRHPVPTPVRSGDQG